MNFIFFHVHILMNMLKESKLFSIIVNIQYQYCNVVATAVIRDNAEIAVASDIIIRCPNARNKNENPVTWALTLPGPEPKVRVPICTRRPTESDCWTGQWQAAQYTNRVTRDNSSGSDVGAYSIRVSGVLISETGKYTCDGDSQDIDKFDNVRIISELYFIMHCLIITNSFLKNT